MANKKQKKDKERERRVAKKKLEEAAKRRESEKQNKDSKTTDGKKSIYSKTPNAIAPQVSNAKSKSFTQRRSGG
jgi:hypothetical protein